MAASSASSSATGRPTPRPGRRRRSLASPTASPSRPTPGPAVLVYRNFALREAPAILRGAYADKRLTVPTRLLLGTDDVPIHPALLSGCERRADELEVELVPGGGHFLADERPDLVAERARALF